MEVIDCWPLYVTKVRRDHGNDAKKDRPGFWVDTGAPSSIIGMKELRILATQFGRHLLDSRRSYKTFRLADASFRSLSRFGLPLRTPGSIPPIFITMDVVSADVPALRVLGGLDAESRVADTFEDRLPKGIKISGLRKTDVTTKFSAARLFPDVSSDNVRRVLVECWASIYTLLPIWQI